MVAWRTVPEPDHAAWSRAATCAPAAFAAKAARPPVRLVAVGSWLDLLDHRSASRPRMSILLTPSPPSLRPLLPHWNTPTALVQPPLPVSAPWRGLPDAYTALAAVGC